MGSQANTNVGIMAYLVELIKRALDWLTWKAPEVDINGELFAPINVEQLEKRLRIREEAQRLGRNNTPPTDAEAPYGIELKITQAIEQRRNQYFEGAQSKLEYINDRFNRLRAQLQDATIQGTTVSDDFERQASAHLSEVGKHLEALALEVKLRDEELHKFQHDNRLDRLPSPNALTSWTRKLAALPLCAVIEGIINAGLYARGVETGLIGGFWIAFVLAGANIALAGTFGACLVRQKNHVKSLRKAIGIGSLILAIAIAIAMAMIIGHYRDALALDSENPFTYVAGKLHSEPWQFSDVTSFVLLILTLCFAIFALWHAYTMDDVYPGYGKVARRAEQAKQNYEFALQILREELEEYKNAALKQLDNTVNEARAAEHEMSKLIEEKRGLEGRYTAALRSSQFALDSLLGIFRQENSIHRTTPPPKYFSQLPQLKSLPQLSFDTTNEEVEIRKAREQLADFVTHVQSQRSAIDAAFNRQYEMAQPLEEHFNKTKHGEGLAA